VTRTLLIDSDVLVYKAASSAQTNLDWGEVASVNLDEAQAIRALTAQVIELQDILHGDKIIMALGDPNGKNWRKDILPSYKANRDPDAKPKLIGFLREFINKTWNTYSRPTLEGDDVLGILSTAPDLVRGERIIVSIDKDFQSIPGKLYNPGKPQLGIRTINRDQADYYHAYQTLIGDATDGYKGCPGVGPKRATAVLGPIPKDEYWAAIVAQYEAKGLTEEDALVQARVARICRDEDYDRINKKVILWTPPKVAGSEIIQHNEDGEAA
jgi:DNA polymerase-1